MGSTSIIPAALMRVCILSACVQFIPVSNRFRGSSNFFSLLRNIAPRGRRGTHRDLDTVVGEDQRRVGSCELCSRHCECVVLCRF